MVSAVRQAQDSHCPWCLGSANPFQGVGPSWHTAAAWTSEGEVREEDD